jgi:hypothetical protein
MKIKDLKPGQTVYSVIRHKMGNTRLSTIGVYPVEVVSIDEAAGIVMGQWNGNPPRSFLVNNLKGWRKSKPLLIRDIGGRSRLATREEIKAANDVAKPLPKPEFSFCENIAAGPQSPWHIRQLVDGIRKLGGGANTSALCGRSVAWDLAVPIDQHHLGHCCSECAKHYNSRRAT